MNQSIVNQVSQNDGKMNNQYLQKQKKITKFFDVSLWLCVFSSDSRDMSS